MDKTTLSLLVISGMLFIVFAIIFFALVSVIATSGLHSMMLVITATSAKHGKGAKGKNPLRHDSSNFNLLGKLFTP